MWKQALEEAGLRATHCRHFLGESDLGNATSIACVEDSKGVSETCFPVESDSESQWRFPRCSFSFSNLLQTRPFPFWVSGPSLPLTSDILAAANRLGRSREMQALPGARGGGPVTGWGSRREAWVYPTSKYTCSCELHTEKAKYHIFLWILEEIALIYNTNLWLRDRDSVSFACHYQAVKSGQGCLFGVSNLLGSLEGHPGGQVCLVWSVMV